MGNSSSLKGKESNGDSETHAFTCIRSVTCRYGRAAPVQRGASGVSAALRAVTGAEAAP